MTTVPDATTEEPAGEAARAGKRFVTLGDGRIVAPARDREVFLAWGIDSAIVIACTFAIYVTLAAAFPDLFSYARELNALTAWPAVAFLYGLTTCYRRSVGQRIAGTRTLRIDNGAVPGFWRAGWMMVLRVVIFPVIFGFCLLGGGTFGVKDRHISVDALATGL